MRASTLIATLQWLGVVPSFSRPHVSDDNPYSESLFRTLKHTPAYPRLPFAGLASHNVGWRGSSLVQRSIAQRLATDARAPQDPPERWTRSTRNWTPVGAVILNPQGASEAVIR